MLNACWRRIYADSENILATKLVLPRRQRDAEVGNSCPRNTRNTRKKGPFSPLSAYSGRCQVARELAMSLVEWLRARAALRSAPNARARSQKAASIVERRPGHLSAAATASQHKGSQMAFFRVFRVFRGLTNKKICVNLR